MSSQSAGVKVFSKRMFPHQVITTPRSMQPLGQRAQHRRRGRLVDEVEARLRPSRRTSCLDPVDEQIGGGGLVTADVGQRDVAEGALLPVAAVGQRELVPAAVRPEAVHRVQHLEQRDVARRAAGRRRSAYRSRRAGRRAPTRRSRAPPGRSRARRCDGAGGRPPIGGSLATAQMLEQAQERPLAVVERHVVEAVEHARLARSRSSVLT